jgi:light-regulated signal transduction histidine kinase (bacteriophytochrome)
MAQLIDDLLEFSRQGRAEMHLARVNMRALAAAAFREVSGGEEGRGDFTLAELPEVVGDASMLRQVWVNLLSNALKFCRPGDRARIAVDGSATDGEVVYTVRDEGVGFDMKYAHKLFGVFQRLHSLREFPGTGVGLALVRRVVERHGGRVWAEGTVGSGSAFHFALPRGLLEVQ